MYDQAGSSVEQSTFLGYTHEVTEKEARLKLIDLIRRMNRRALQIHNIGPEDALKKELAFNETPSRFLNGAISELIVAADLMARGYEVFRALCPQSSCDLVALKNGEFQRIEVKTNGLATIYRNLGKFDLAAVFSTETGKVEYRSALNLRDTKIAGNCRDFAVSETANELTNKGCTE